LGDTLYAGGLFTSAGGNLIPFVAEWIPTPPVIMAIDNSEKTKFSVLIFPNPVSEKISVRFSGNGSLRKNNYSFKLFDLPGKEILNTYVTDEIYFDRKNIPSGLYIYRITDGETILSQGKISFR